MTKHRRRLPTLLGAFVGLVACATAAVPEKPLATAVGQSAASSSGSAPIAAAPAQESKQAKEAPKEPTLTVDQMKAFLLHAEIVKSRGTPKGITSPWRLTLSDGTITHEAAFQTIDESAPRREFANGTIEFNFVDSYRYDIAAYELAALLGLGDMMPVTVERTWQGKTGALSWWLPSVMDEQTHREKKTPVPDVEVWNRQMYKKWIFAELVYDTDPNMTNILISADWHLWMIDFSRAFRLHKDLREPKNIEKATCSRELLERLRTLNREDVEKAVDRKLTKYEVDGVMARRDRIVAIFDQRIKRDGENAVLYSEKRP
jgi:hypothetical protein